MNRAKLPGCRKNFAKTDPEGNAFLKLPKIVALGRFGIPPDLITATPKGHDDHGKALPARLTPIEAYLTVARVASES